MRCSQIAADTREAAQRPSRRGVVGDVASHPPRLPSALLHRSIIWLVAAEPNGVCTVPSSRHGQMEGGWLTGREGGMRHATPKRNLLRRSLLSLDLCKVL